MNQKYEMVFLLFLAKIAHSVTCSVLQTIQKLFLEMVGVFQ